MPHYHCVIEGCKSDCRHPDNTGSFSRFFPLPVESQARELWLRFINRGQSFQPARYTRVCEKHFPDREPTNQNPIPCLLGTQNRPMEGHPLVPVKTHPSVRVKGTEANFSPTQCCDSSCPGSKTLHMHCPFCVRTECYQDPVILKMHYRVKHVDKGIEFAGLKILRCCDRCDIVGAIKGEKKFKGAHWHCYKCRNGFNRRDEAIKHYKTHFRNPETTFQIQISQLEESTHAGQLQEDQAASTVISGSMVEGATIHPVLTEAVMSTSSQGSGMLSRRGTVSLNRPDGEVHVPVAANETVDASGAQTIMIIQQEDIDTNNSAIDNSYTVISTDDYSDDNSVMGEPSVNPELQAKYSQLQQQCNELQLERSQLKAEVEQLKMKIYMQSQELDRCQKREQELLSQLRIPLDKGLQELLLQLETSHKELLHQQLALVRRKYLEQLSQQNQTITIPSAALQKAVLGTTSGSISITIQQNGIHGEGVHVIGDSESATLQLEPTPEEQLPSEINPPDGEVLQLIPLSDEQQPIPITEAFSAPCSTHRTTTVTLSGSDHYEESLQTGVHVPADESFPYSHTTNSIQVSEAGDFSVSSFADKADDDPPAKRRKEEHSN